RWLLGSFCDQRPTLPATDLGFGRYQAAGLIEVRGPIERFEGHTAYFAAGKQADFDVVVAATGYRFAAPFLPAEVARAPAGHPVARPARGDWCRVLNSVGWPARRPRPGNSCPGSARAAPGAARRAPAGRGRLRGARAKEGGEG